MTAQRSIQARADQPGARVLAAAFAAVFALSVASVYFAPGASDVAAWWPAAGVGTGLLALSSPRRWSLLLAMGVLVTGAANLVAGRDALVSGLFGVVNATEWLVVALLLGAHRERPWLRSRRDFVRFIAAAGLGALVVGFLVGVVVAIVMDGSLVATMSSVTASHGASQLLVVPVMLLVTDPRARSRVAVPDAVVVSQIVSIIVVTVLVHRVGQNLPLVFLPSAFLVWGALVLSLRALAVEALVVGALVTVLTAQGGGPFGAVSALSGSATAALVQVDLVVIALVSLPLALVMAERSVAVDEALADRKEAQSAQRELRREQDFTAALLAATTGTSIIATDATGRITYVNSGAENLFGYAGTDLIGRPLNFLHIDEEIADRTRELQARSAFEAVVGDPSGDAGAASHDWTYRRADGGRLRISVRVSPLLTPAGDLLGYLSVGEDITSRQATQESLRRHLETERAAVERLLDLDRDKSEFLATVSHELRTPLTSVLGYTQVLSEGSVGPLSDRQHDLLRRVERGGQRLMGLIENILTFSRIETSDETSEHVPVDARALAQSALRETEALRWNRRLEVTGPAEESAPLVVIGDADQLKRAVINLLSNAIKFTPDGGSIEVRLHSEDPDRVLIEVTDTGMGIPVPEQLRLFDRFFRGSNAISNSVQGTGLGLAIVRTIVEAHDGVLSVKSAPDEGTTVTLELPRERSTPVDRDQAPSETSDATRPSSASASNGLTM